ncbi:hypothetical protein BDZ97DRAFT_1839559 [Flammula alnicola]|nr:hypothetical protein BDZ97DRAFT_1839559 [Flammula alnicola]
MSSGCVPRASIDASRHGTIDTELKSLKLLSRRLQSTLTIQATELQILHRLYYKNKNQHRGSLFWRNVAELRRYLERVDNLNLQDSTSALRYAFYNSTENTNSTRGPWTHFPDEKNLSSYAKQCQTGLKLLEKMSEVCLTAYRSFHRSLQSAAFLQILLMFVAISSRMRMLSLELQEILRQILSCANRLLVVLSATSGEALGLSNSTSFLQAAQDVDLEMADVDLGPSVNLVRRETPQPVSKASRQSSQNENTTSSTSSRIIVERIESSKSRKGSEQPKQAYESVSVPKKKKRRPKNEIDEIFGF